MNEMTELIPLVALLRYGSYRSSQMKLRQRLIGGEKPSEIIREESEQERLIDQANNDVQHWLSTGENPLSWLDSDYPQQLRDVHDFPPIIFTRGNLKEIDQGICIVGSRNARPQAISATRQIARILCNSGWTVVSGLAKGIDTAAHTETLKLQGRTVAVIGNGIDQTYPKENAGLQREIEDRGLILSQFWPGSSPTKFTFPMRNAVMSAYASATIIVSAEEKSGTRHQARQAVAHGRPLVVSGSVYEDTSWGRRLVNDPYTLSAVAYSPEEAVQQAMEMTRLTQSGFPF